MGRESEALRVQAISTLMVGDDEVNWLGTDTWFLSDGSMGKAGEAVDTANNCIHQVFVGSKARYSGEGQEGGYARCDVE